MSYLVGEMGAYLLVAAVIGVLIGWFLSRCKCNKAIAEIESQKQALTSEFNSVKGELASTQQQLTASQNSVVQLRSDVAIAEGNAHLMSSRWQSTLKQARQTPNQLKWIQSLQVKLADKKTQLSQNRKFAEAKAWEAKATKENLTRVHTRLTEVDTKVSNLKDWVSVFQTKLLKTKTDYGQLRSYANAVAQSDRAHRDNLARAHNRLTEIENKQQPLRTWIRVFQTKLMKTKSDYNQLRSYADNIQTSLSANEDNLNRTHTRLSEVTNELQNLRDRRNNPMPPLPPPVDVSDNKTLRLVDRIRLLGTSKKEVYGRMHNQIREARLETIETERVLTDSCEEKDAIINDLRVQLRKTENRAQKAPVVQLDQSVKIKELESELAQVKAESQSHTELEDQIREHRFTIDAYRSKLSETKNQLFTQRIQSPETTTEGKIPTLTDSAVDDLKLIKGVGPKIEGMLNDLGIYKFSQIAAWKQKDIDEISSKLGSFKDRISRDDWVKKARKLDKNK
ncbi:MAG: hypothetical protein R8G33_11970 [Gammaproteobacteria bacterium]|nr:hypothetical protein [Gammaproteobacteria bacterium]